MPFEFLEAKKQPKKKPQCEQGRLLSVVQREATAIGCQIPKTVFTGEKDEHRLAVHDLPFWVLVEPMVRLFDKIAVGRIGKGHKRL